MKDTLQNKPYSHFENENAKGKRGAYAGSEWTPYNLSTIKQWIDMRDNYVFTDNENDIYGGDWEQLDIKEYHSKYGANYIYIDNERKLWRLRTTADEFYNHTPYKRPKMNNTEINNIAEQLEKHSAYIITSIGGKGNHIGRIKGFSLDANGDLIIEADIDAMSCTR